MAETPFEETPWGWLLWKEVPHASPIPLKSRERNVPIAVGRSYKCDVTVPRASAVRSMYNRVSLRKHCTLCRYEDGTVLLRPYSLDATFVNSSKVKLFTTRRIRDGDIVSLVSLQDGPWFTYHTDEPGHAVSVVDGDVAERVSFQENEQNTQGDAVKPPHK